MKWGKWGRSSRPPPPTESKAIGFAEDKEYHFFNRSIHTLINWR
jgi:hypothetical protein